jgi:Cu2+-exporting ATPase
VTCDLCDLPTPDPPVTGDGVEGEFCCRGCAEVAGRLDTTDADPDEVRAELGDDADELPESTEEAFLAVDGMHCATCEAFVEATATREDGVLDADASYATDVVKLAYDPDRVAAADLPDAVSRLGYRARRVDEDPDDPEEGVGRLLVGGFFGMMVMLWYLLFLYPAYLGVPAEYRLLDVTGSSGRFLLWNVWVMASVVLGYAGYPLLRGAYVSLRAGRPNMDLLVGLAATAAYVYSTVLLLLGGHEVYFDVTVAVVVVVTVGNYYEDRVKRRASGVLADLAGEQVDEARRRAGDRTETVPLAALAGGDEVVVRPGGRVPVDGTVVEGAAGVDESLVTGESAPVRVEPGDDVIGGAVVTDGRLVVAVAEGAASTLDRLTRLLWDVQAARPGAQRLADRVAGVFVPLVVVLSGVALAGHLLAGAAFGDALLVALAVLVVSCPCALGLATPLAVAAGVRAALDEGVVVRDASVFERAPDVDVVAFDKTGTLTTGRMRVVDGGDRALRRAAAVEQFSAHPVAEAITDAADPGEAAVKDFETHPGRGVSARVGGERVVVGHPDLFADEGWPVPGALREQVAAAREDGHTPVVVGWGGEAHSVVVLGDDPRDGWREVVSAVGENRTVVVVTGDDERAARRFREHPAIDHVFAGVPPDAKTEVVERLQADGSVAMIGDGSNDAPALAAADLGIALGGGTALAADAADAVVTTDDLRTLPAVFDLPAAARRRIRENLGWAFLYNAVAVPAAALGLLSPVLAAGAMAASSLLVVVNSARALGERDGSAGGDSPHEPHVEDDTVTDPADASECVAA